MQKILTIVGTRPNIIKITRFGHESQKYPLMTHSLLHTGQHYSQNMSDVFFTELALNKPDFVLHSDTSSVISQLAHMMQGIEQVVNTYKPKLMIVVGDVNSTLAAALVANKMGIRLAHVESGLRSLDRSMPEEINRILTDSLTDILFVTEQSGVVNLLKEGKREDQIFLVGNTMIDTLVAYNKQIRDSTILQDLQIASQTYCLMTMHRPGNVDTEEGLLKIVEVIEMLTRKTRIVFPIHPRTFNKVKEYNLQDKLTGNKNLILLEPAGYLDFQHLILHAQFVITDSGGIQEETTYRQIPCITLRPNTERPSTIDIGSNTLLNFDKEKIEKTVEQIFSNTYKPCAIPPLWDGNATGRIFEVISKV
jgi:UDP-N-acetylglucosamine 2-epimerase (non-hydrolysing)